MALVDLETWAAHNIPTTKLSRSTLSAYARIGRFYPKAVKVGRSWHVREDAELLPEPAPISAKPISDPVVARIFASA